MNRDPSPPAHAPASLPTPRADPGPAAPAPAMTTALPAPGALPDSAAPDEISRLQALAGPAQARARARRRARLAARQDRGACDPPPPRLSPTQQAGRRMERAAARYLAGRGLRLLGANLRARAGEIDLVADDGGVLVFIEVRHRSSERHGGAAASVNRGKQGRLIRSAQALLPGLVQRHYQGRLPACRFDVLAWEADGPRWLRDAFRADPYD